MFSFRDASARELIDADNTAEHLDEMTDFLAWQTTEKTRHA